MMSRTTNRPTEWERRWAPTYLWPTLVPSLLFRQESTDYVFDIHRNRKYYHCVPHGSVNFNYCPLCATGQRYKCLFYHPAVSVIFVDVVNSLDKTKREPELNNIEVQARIINQLPSLFASLGYPCEIGDELVRIQICIRHM